ncbi:hypothetical protein [Noviherbaspirillum massiliense]|uniref:hypothetical protein n=1 Tax=Noviherbaspirillum massiliense TaxID=1465823 RepID=UPI0002D68231|nr:hypothetical protein [Noviherbaspirillum massiliense]
MDDAKHIDNRFEMNALAAQQAAASMAALKPKGSCWYCNQPLDNVRRFCSKACADDYRTEEEVFKSF